MTKSDKFSFDITMCEKTGDIAQKTNVSNIPFYGTTNFSQFHWKVNKLILHPKWIEHPEKKRISIFQSKLRWFIFMLFGPPNLATFYDAKVSSSIDLS